MERAHREPAHGLFAEAVRQAFQHFGGGLTGEGDGGDPGGGDALVLDQPRDAGNERAGFARARPGDDRRAGGLRADGGGVYKRQQSYILHAQSRRRKRFGIVSGRRFVL